MQTARHQRQAEATPAAESFVSWLALDDQPVPHQFQALAPTVIRSLSDVRPSTLCLFPLNSETFEFILTTLRSVLGDALYVIAVSSTPLSAITVQRLFALGADDYHCPAEPDDLARCLARAGRSLRRLRQEMVERSIRDRDFELLHAGLNHLPTPISFKDETGRYTFCNTAFRNLISQPNTDIIGRRVSDLLPPELAARHQELDALMLDEGLGQCFETDLCVVDGTPRHVLIHKARIEGDEGEALGIASVMIDITDRKQLESKLTEAAERDSLTNAYNRRKFFSLAQEAVAEVAVTREPLAVAIIDIDHFKAINDEFGHSEGDRILCEVVSILHSQAGEDAIVARAGGEEFFLFFRGDAAIDACSILERIRAEIARYCRVSTTTGSAGTVSAGLSTFDPTRQTIDQALRRADSALYLAKDGGRNRVCAAT